MKIFIAGEGTDDIGDWAEAPAYLPPTPSGGVVEALLQHFSSASWTIAAGCKWSRIRQHAYGRDLHGRERRRLLGVVDLAIEKGCDAIVFVRDEDGEPGRDEAIEQTIAEVANGWSEIHLAGGLAIVDLDSWILALLGGTKSEQTRNAKDRLQDSHSIVTGEQKAHAVRTRTLDAIPNDAHSLRRWIERVSRLVSPAI